MPGVCDPLIKEFYANAVLREHEINCWIRGKEFTIDVDDIDDVLGFEGMDDHDFTRELAKYQKDPPSPISIS